MTLRLDGVDYQLVGGSLIKALHTQGHERTDDKGRKWSFNEQTRRWRLAEGSKQAKGKGKEGANAAQADVAPKTTVKPKSSKAKNKATLDSLPIIDAKAGEPTAKRPTKAVMTRKINKVMAGTDGPMHVDDLAIKTGIDRDTLHEHLGNLRDRGKLHDHGDGHWHHQPKAKAAKPKSKRTKKGKEPQAQAEESGLKPKNEAGLVHQPRSLTAKPSPDQDPSDRAKPSSGSTTQDDIDGQYASDDPSEEDAQNWLRDSALQFASPSDKALHARTMQDMKLSFNVHGDDTVIDRATLAEAAVRHQDEYLAEFGDNGKYSPRHFGMWVDEKEIAKAERQMKSGRTPEARAKAKTKFEKLSAQKAEDLRIGQEIADRKNAEVSRPREERVADFLTKYDRNFEALKQQKTELYEKVKKGNRQAVDEASRGAIAQALHPAMNEDLDAGDVHDFYNGTAKQKKQAQTRLIQQHLRQVHQKGGGDSKTLGIQGEPTAAELKSAYRRAAMAHHPDHGGSREKFDQVRGAYERMMDRYYPELKKTAFAWVRFQGETQLVSI